MDYISGRPCSEGQWAPTVGPLLLFFLYVLWAACIGVYDLLLNLTPIGPLWRRLVWVFRFTRGKHLFQKVLNSAIYLFLL